MNRHDHDHERLLAAAARFDGESPVTQNGVHRAGDDAADTDAFAAVDAALRRRFAVPRDLVHLLPGALDPQAAAARHAPDPAGPARAGTPSSPAAARAPRHRGHRLALAALLMMVVGGWLIVRALLPAPPAPYHLRPERSPAELHAALVDGTLTPDWICRDDAEFREAFARRLGAGLVPRLGAPGIALTGIAFTPSLSPRTVAILGRVGDVPVLVLVDRLERDPAPAPPPAPLRHHRIEVGPLVLYEISALPTAMIAPGLALDDPDARVPEDGR